MKSFLSKYEKRIARISIFILFLALIRCISEPFRMQYRSSDDLVFEQLKPFLIGGLVASTGLLLMILLLFYNNYKAIILVAILAIIGLLIVKTIF